MTSANYTGWNHRVMRRVFTPAGYDEATEWFTIHEVYYNFDGSVATFTKEGIRPHGESLEELKESIQMFQRALDQPVLEYGDY